MSKNVLMIPADSDGNMLFIKEPVVRERRLFVKYKSSYNDIPFMETQLYSADADGNVCICGSDGTILYKFNSKLLDSLF